MRCRVAYGMTGLSLTFGDDVDLTVVRTERAPPVQDPCTAIRQALENPIASPPLSELVHSEDRVVIVFSDITRPVPTAEIVTGVLEQLRHVPSSRITLLNALGTHSRQTAEELAVMLGPDIVERHEVLQHDAADASNLVRVGTSSYGHPFWLHRRYVEATARILTGCIEPHFFAGYSGGPKAVVPGIAGMETILANHSPEMLASPNATWGCTEGNPVWMEMCELALMAGPAFLVNVSVSRDRRITGIFAGDLARAHARGVAFVRDHALRYVPAPFDVVITSNAGYPLDQNLYQAVKGMSAAARIARPGGHIIVAAECRSGIPTGSNYERILRSADSASDLANHLASEMTATPEQWQVAIQLAVQKKATVHLRSDGLSEGQIRAAHLEPCRSIEALVTSLLSRHAPHPATVCLLPDGPETIPTLEDAVSGRT